MKLLRNLLLALLLAAPASADQFDFGTIDPGTKTGTALAGDLNSWRDAVHSTHRGGTQPSYRVAGMFWEDTSGGATSTLLKVYDGSDWITLGTVNETANSFTPSGALTASGGNLTGALNFAKGSNITAAATTDIGAATGNVVDVTGSTTITGLGTVQAGTVRVVRFTGAPLLTHNGTSLILPTGASIQAAAGDVAVFVSLGSGNWYCANYSPAAGPVGIASQAEAETGTNNTKGMTALRVAQAIDALSTPGGFSNLNIYDESGTFVVPANITKIYVRAWGGGGGGGAGQNGGAGGGGGAGGYAEKIIAVTPAAEMTVTIGAAGAAAGNGGSTSLDSEIVAPGGTAGSQGSSAGGAGGAGGAPSTGDLNIDGGAGLAGIGAANGNPGYAPGLGGSAAFAPGARSTLLPTASVGVSGATLFGASPPTGFAHGGAGGRNSGTGTTNGVAGRPGLMIIWY
jgi:hypothetical protein